MSYTSFMSSSDDYIIIEEGHDLNDDAKNDTFDTPQESADLSTRTLEKQGILVEKNEDIQDISNKHLDDFSKELFEEGGIEIVSNEGENGEPYS